jgi:hypothetical protein
MTLIALPRRTGTRLPRQQEILRDLAAATAPQPRIRTESDPFADHLADELSAKCLRYTGRTGVPTWQRVLVAIAAVAVPGFLLLAPRMLLLGLIGASSAVALTAAGLSAVMLLVQRRSQAPRPPAYSDRLAHRELVRATSLTKGACTGSPSAGSPGRCRADFSSPRDSV